MKLLLSILVCIAVSAVTAEYGNLVVGQSKLDLQFLGKIHDYAWADSAPDPYYPAKFYPGSNHDLQRFLDLQTHIPADHPAAASLVEVASTTSTEARVDETFFGFGGDGGGDADDDEANPALEATDSLDPVKSPFQGGAPQPGSFPGADDYRRGLYGPRRRRSPYDVTAATVNPFRKLNNYQLSPNNVLFPRYPSTALSDPYGASYANQVGFGGLPYGGYSASRNRKFSANNMLAPFTPAYPAAFASPAFASPVALFPAFTAGAYPAALAYAPAPVFGYNPYNPAGGRDSYNPLFGGPSPYIMGGDYKYFDLYKNIYDPNLDASTVRTPGTPINPATQISVGVGNGAATTTTANTQTNADPSLSQQPQQSNP